MKKLVLSSAMAAALSIILTPVVASAHSPARRANAPRTVVAVNVNASAGGFAGDGPVVVRNPICNVRGPVLAWRCDLHSRVEGTDFAFIIRGTDMWGKGTISCRSACGARFDSPIELHMVGGGIGAQVAVPTGKPGCMSITGLNLGIANPRAMFGQFRFAPEVNVQFGQAQLAAGAGVNVTARNGGGVSLSLHAKAMCGVSVGLGIGVNANVINIMTPNQARAYRRQLVAQQGQYQQPAGPQVAPYAVR